VRILPRNSKTKSLMGAYVPQEDRSLSYKERGWVSDQASGSNAGTFESVGAFKVNPSGTRFAGPGTFTMADLNGVVFYLRSRSRPSRRRSPCRLREQIFATESDFQSVVPYPLMLGGGLLSESSPSPKMLFVVRAVMRKGCEIATGICFC
jgi:hypothetical protein